MSINLDTNVLSIKLEKINKKINFYNSLYFLLEDSKRYYPDFYKWYHNKVIPGLLNLDRKLVLEYRNGLVAGIAIIKKSENKVCTLQVIDGFKNKGIALKLIERCFLVLETRQPFFTISEEKLPEYQTIFEHYAFKCTSIHDSLYRSSKKEYFFNE